MHRYNNDDNVILYIRNRKTVKYLLLIFRLAGVQIFTRWEYSTNTHVLIVVDKSYVYIYNIVMQYSSPFPIDFDIY